MKKLLPLISFLAIAALSCKKSGSSGSYYIKATVNGIPKTFSTLAKASKQDTLGATVFYILGATNPSDTESVDLEISNSPSGKPIVAGAYSQLDYTDFAVFGAHAFKTTIFGAGYVSHPANPFRITISSITGNTVSGTFSGDFYDLSTGLIQSNTPFETFTNGEFRVQLEP